jgi:hypothetical protein
MRALAKIAARGGKAVDSGLRIQKLSASDSR